MMEVNAVVHPPRAETFREGVPPPVLTVARFQQALQKVVDRKHVAEVAAAAAEMEVGITQTRAK